MPGRPVSLKLAVWTTAWGPMGAVACQRGLTRIVLPHYGPEDLMMLLAFEHPRAVPDPDAFQELIRLSRAYFNAQRASFAELACDLPAESTFAGRLLRACRDIPYGQTRSYSWLAAAGGRPDAARAAAAALARNALPLVIPCHRVIYSDGRLGGFSGPGGAGLKRRMLLLEKALLV